MRRDYARATCSNDILCSRAYKRLLALMESQEQVALHPTLLVPLCNHHGNQHIPERMEQQ